MVDTWTINMWNHHKRRYHRHNNYNYHGWAGPPPPPLRPPSFYSPEGVKGPFLPGASMSRPFCNYGDLPPAPSIFIPHPAAENLSWPLIKIRENLTCWWITASSSLFPQIFHRDVFIPNLPCSSWWWSTSGRYFFEKVQNLSTPPPCEGLILAEFFLVFRATTRTRSRTRYGRNKKMNQDQDHDQKDILKKGLNYGSELIMGAGSSSNSKTVVATTPAKIEEGDDDNNAEIENVPYQGNGEEGDEKIVDRPDQLEEEQGAEILPKYEENDDQDDDQDFRRHHQTCGCPNCPLCPEFSSSSSSTSPSLSQEKSEDEDDDEDSPRPHQFPPKSTCTALVKYGGGDNEDEDEDFLHGHGHPKSCGCGAGCPAPPDNDYSLTRTLSWKKLEKSGDEEKVLSDDRRLVPYKFSRSSGLPKYGEEDNNYHRRHHKSCGCGNCPVVSEEEERRYEFVPSLPLKNEETPIEEEEEEEEEETWPPSRWKVEEQVKVDHGFCPYEFARSEYAKAAVLLRKYRDYDEQEEEEEFHGHCKDCGCGSCPVMTMGKGSAARRYGFPESTLPLEERCVKRPTMGRKAEQEEEEEMSSGQSSSSSSGHEEEDEDDEEGTICDEEEKIGDDEEEEETLCGEIGDEKEEKIGDEEEEKIGEKEEKIGDEKEEKIGETGEKIGEKDEKTGDDDDSTPLPENHTTGLEEISSDEMEEMFHGKMKVQKEKKVEKQKKGGGGDEDKPEKLVVVPPPSKKEMKKKASTILVKRGDPPVPWIVHPTISRPWIRYPRRNLDPDGKILAATIKLGEELRQKYNELAKSCTGKSKRKRGKTAFPTNTIGIRELIRNDKRKGTLVGLSLAKLKRKVNLAKKCVVSSSSSSTSMPTTPIRTRKISGGGGRGQRSHSATWPRIGVKSKEVKVEKVTPDLNNNTNATIFVENVGEIFLDASNITATTTTWSYSTHGALSSVLGVSTSTKSRKEIVPPPKITELAKIVDFSNIAAKIRASKTGNSASGRTSHHLGVPTKRGSLGHHHHPHHFRQQQQQQQAMSTYHNNPYLFSKNQAIPPPPGFPPRPPPQQRVPNCYNFGGLMAALQASRPLRENGNPVPTTTTTPPPTATSEGEKQYNNNPAQEKNPDLMFSQVVGLHYSQAGGSRPQYQMWGQNTSGDTTTTTTTSSGGGGYQGQYQLFGNNNVTPTPTPTTSSSGGQNLNQYHVRYQQQQPHHHNHHHNHGNNQNQPQTMNPPPPQQSPQLNNRQPPQMMSHPPQQMMPMMFSPQQNGNPHHHQNNNQPQPQPPHPPPPGWFYPPQQQPQQQQQQPPQKKCVFLQRSHGPMANLYSGGGVGANGGGVAPGQMLPSRIHYWQDVQDHNTRQQQLHQNAVRNARICYLAAQQGQGQGQLQGQGQVPFLQAPGNVMLLSPRPSSKGQHFHQAISSPPGGRGGQHNKSSSLRSVSSTGSILDQVPRPPRQHKSPRSFTTTWSDSSSSSSDPATSQTPPPRSPDVREGQGQEGQNEDDGLDDLLLLP